MTTDSARMWITKASLSATGLFFLFFVSAPALGYPLTFDQSFRLLQILLPVFLGYLGSASMFLVKTAGANDPSGTAVQGPLFQLLIRWPIIVFSCVLATLLVVFAYSNRGGAPAGSGMSIDTLSTVFSAALGLLAATTGALLGVVFPQGGKK
jgi:hypothetical protein